MYLIKNEYTWPWLNNKPKSIIPNRYKDCRCMVCRCNFRWYINV